MSRDLLPQENPISSLYPVFDPWGKSPRFSDFVLQLAFGPKWPQTKFGFKPLKPGRAAPQNVFFPLFRSFSEMPLFHFYIFVAFYSLGVKLGRLLVWSMVDNSANGQGPTIKVT